MVLFIVGLVMLIAGAVLSSLLAPKPPTLNSEGQSQTAPQNDPSRYVGVVFGRARIQDPIVGWSGNYSAEPIMSDQGGKK